MFAKKNNVKVQFDSMSLYEGHQKIKYRGIDAIKCPFDYVMYQMIIWELQPDLIIEIGTNRGGTALYFADILNIIGKGKVHTIDILESYSDPILESYNNIELYTDGYQGYDLQLAKGYEKILVIEDGSHTYEDTIAAMIKFGPIVTKDSYMIIEDGIVNELGMEKQFNGGPLRAIKEYLSTTDDWFVY